MLSIHSFRSILKPNTSFASIFAQRSTASLSSASISTPSHFSSKKFRPTFAPNLLFHSSSSLKMAHSKFEYVKKFEQDDALLPNTWLVVRVDGRGFHKFVDAHDFKKPNDYRGLDLMSKCAEHIMKEHPDIVCAYGCSDEYSFVLRKSCSLWHRRASKLSTSFSSLFASSYVFYWTEFFPETKLLYPPCFDGRVVCYPADQNLRDYLSWRQADCHINNLYNTAFWTLVQEGGSTPAESEEALRGTLADFKNEMLFSRFGINYGTLPQQERKGTFLMRKEVEETVEREGASAPIVRRRKKVVPVYDDIISEAFWRANPELLADR